MAQQTQFKKLKEQIEAAKRGLIETSGTEIDEVTPLVPSPFASPEVVEAKQTKISLGDVRSNESITTRVVDMASKTAPCDTPIVDHELGNSTRALADEFKFFHREKQPKSSVDPVSDASLQETNNVETDAVLFQRLGRRLAILEGDVEQNRKYIHELINLLSKLELRQKPLNRKMRPPQRFNRCHIFWLVIGFLAVGWFGLTPSGHLAVRHILTLM